MKIFVMFPTLILIFFTASAVNAPEAREIELTDDSIIMG
jgi:hypothetical protein